MPSLPRRIALALAATAPVVLLYAAQTGHVQPGEAGFSWFIHNDMATYSANAREYVDDPTTSLLYRNPFSWDAESPRLYFQPPVWLLGQIHAAIDVDPGLLLAAMGFIATFFAFLLLQRLLDGYLPMSGLRRTFAFVFVAWGGGTLVIASILTGQALDPGGGMWFLNLGRNFIYPLEAVYHLIVVALLLAALRHRLPQVLAFTWLLVLCHPFTGAQYAGIVAGWALVERVVVRSERLRWAQAALLTTPLIGAIGYYLVWLPSDPSHAQLTQQWTIDWSASFASFAFAYLVVGGAALARCWGRERFAAVAADPFNRLLIIAALCSLALANHDVVLSRPIQPLHFTRGHVWFPLALVGLPVLVGLFDIVRDRIRPALSIVLIGCLLAVLTLDNIAFFVHRTTTPTGLFLTVDERALFEHLDTPGAEPIVVTDEPRVAAFVSTWSSVRPWVGHWANTPFVAERKADAAGLFEAGRIPTELQARSFLVVTTASELVEAALKRAGLAYTARVGSFVIYERAAP